MKKLSKSTIVGIVCIILIFIVFYFLMHSSKTQTSISAINSSTGIVSTSTNATTTQTATKVSTTKKVSSSKVLSGHVYISIINSVYTPKTITIKSGTTVTWTNKDSIVHTVTADNGGPTSNELGKGESYSYKYNVKGIFGYHCSIHSTSTGTVIVQ